MPPTYSIEEAPPPEKQGKFEMRKPSLLIPKPKLSGSREWITNLFSPNKSRNPSCSETPETNSRYFGVSHYIYKICHFDLSQSRLSKDHTKVAH